MNDLANIVSNDELELKRLKKLRRSRRKERTKQKRLEALAADQQPIELEQPTKASGNSEATEPQRHLPKQEKTEVPRHESKSQRRFHIPLAFLAAGLAIVGLIINGYFSWTRGTSDLDKILFAGIGFVTESVAFFLPSRMAALWRQRSLGAFAVACVIYPLLLAFALLNSLGFAAVNLNDVSTVRAERISPAVADAQRRLDTLTASRKQACDDDKKVGTRCFRLQREEQAGFEQLTYARQQQKEGADPQISAAQKLVSWITAGSLTPKVDDFGMLRLLLLTLLPQAGGLILLLARR